MTAQPDLVASLVQQEFDKLPAKRKPVVRDNGLCEWVPLSGIVAEGRGGKLTCLSLATGMKCLPSSKLSQAQGNVLHDWHAEILAIRAFNCFVLDECRALAGDSGGSSAFLRRRTSTERTSVSDSDEWHGQPFAWREDVLLHMYCSEAPCGDASMELTMASQADATPWATPRAPDQGGSSSPTPSAAALVSRPLEPGTLLPGRAYFSELGIVRRKPSRGDAPPTLSKSCSDKLSLRQCTSLLSSVASLLVSPENAYLATLTLPSAQYSASGCRRAFSDGKGESDGEGDRNADSPQQQARMAPLVAAANQGREPGGGGGYAFKPFAVRTTDLEFSFSRRSAQAQRTTPPSSCSSSSRPNTDAQVKLTPSNLAAALTASGRLEATLNGVLQGRKASDAGARGASFASRRRTWGLAAEAAGALLLRSEGEDEDELIRQALGVPSRHQNHYPSCSSATAAATAAGGPMYGDVKNDPLLGPRRRAKEAAQRLALKGWVRNLGDEDFVL
ncbi:putative tRNA-specific adenosine deaminase [Rosellinia necatrix]|uniref:Putative tRNA-specific adenosine deaminase n=1 Tax=Rosellinia necatrix TaxID=77044 RepID=A0A1W2TP74_ROSNE|nr:putative tRNA-specific adenosine deaminase [Rosellinia necatrix]